jgi:hypothetical protein
MFVGKEWAQEGGLISYGDLLPERYRLAASICRDEALRSAFGGKSGLAADSTSMTEFDATADNTGIDSIADRAA